MADLLTILQNDASIQAAIKAIVAGTATPTPTPTPTPSPTPTGFALNGSTNPKLKAMLARVKAGTGSGAIAMPGDSLTAGVGAPVTATGMTGTNNATMMTGARPYRQSAVMAALAATAGYPALDAGLYGDASVTPNGVAIDAYDPRLSFTGTRWTVNSDQTFAGGGIVDGGSDGPLVFTPGVSVLTFEAVFYSAGGGGSVTVAIDGAAPSSMSVTGGTVSGQMVTAGAGGGFCRVVARAASAGQHALTLTPNSNNALLRSVVAYPANSLSFLNYGSAGQTCVQAASTDSTNRWKEGEALLSDAPDLTIIQLGANDAYTGGSVSSYQTALASIIANAKVSGDVLVLWCNAVNPTFIPLATQNSFHDACATTAATAGVAFGDIRAATGDWSTIAARTADGLIHPNRGLHADIAAYIWSCVQAMAA